jgi:hypothetical protein
VSQPTYLAGKDAVAHFIEDMAVLDGSYDTEVDFDELTNLKSGGFHSGIPTVKKWSGSLDAVYEGDSPPEFDEGTFIPAASITIPGGPGVSGDVWITKVSYKGVTPKAGVRYTFTFVSEGPYAKTT